MLTTERRAVTGRLDSGGSTRRGWKLMFESKPVLNPIGGCSRPCGSIYFVIRRYDEESGARARSAAEGAEAMVNGY